MTITVPKIYLSVFILFLLIVTSEILNNGNNRNDINQSNSGGLMTNISANDDVDLF